MGIRSFFSNLFLESRSTNIADPQFWGIDKFGGGLTRSGVPISPESAMRVSTVFACTSLISAVMASLPLQLFKWRKSGGQDPAEDHYLYNLVSLSPNNEQDSYQWREMLQAHLCLRGNTYNYKEMNGLGQYTSLIPLHPSRVEPIREPDGKIWYYFSPNPTLDVSGNSLPVTKYRFPAEYIWHNKTLSLDGLKGLSVIGHARETVGLSQGMQDYGADYFGKKPVPGLVLQTKKKLSDVAKANLKSSIQEFANERRHSAMVLEEDMTIEKLGITNQDGQFIESMSFSVEDICRFFNVPPFLVHHERDKASTFASAEQLSLNFVVFSLVAPWVSRWEASLSKGLLTEKERSKYFFKFNVNALLRGDYLSRMRGYAVGRQWGIFSPNDIRALEDMNPRPGGDQYLDNPQNITGKPANQNPIPNEPAPSKGDVPPKDGGNNA
jgi:HK97 family phage portal protein